MDPRKTAPGMPFAFPAAFYNRLIDVMRWAERQQKLSGSGQAGAASSATNITIKNESGSMVPRFGVLQVSDSLGAAADFENLKTLRGVTPTSALGPVVIVQSAVADDDLAEAVIGGATMARVNVVSTADTHAEPVAGDSDKLRSGTAGRFRLLNPPSATGIQTVLVRFESASEASGLPKVRNLSGQTVPQWGFLIIDGAEPLPSANLAGFLSAPIFRGFSPGALTVFGNRRIVSVPGGAAPGEVVDCIIDGRVPARIFSASQTDPLMVHHSRDLVASNAVRRLEAHHDQTHFGFPVLFRETGTGERWGLVDLSPQNQPAVIAGVVQTPTGIGATVGISTPYNYDGIPFQTLTQNGIVRSLMTPTAIRLDGQSTWMGEVSITFNVRYDRLPIAGASGFYRVPGFRVVLNPRFSPLGFTHAITAAAEMSEKPGLVVGSDYLGVISRVAPSGTNYTISAPFLFQTNPGPLETNGAAMSFQISCQALGGAGSGDVVFGVNSVSLLMHEVDPLLAPPTQGSSTKSSSGFVSSPSLVDPLTRLRGVTTPATGFLRSNGLRAGSTNTESGFE